MLSARNLLYGFAASLVLFTIVMAIEQVYLREVDAVIAASRPSRNAKPGVPRVRGASVSIEGAADIEAAPEDGTVDPGKRPGCRSGRGRLGASQRSPRAGVSRQRRTSKARRWTKAGSIRSPP